MAFYNYIRVYGLAESELEEFQGLGAAALYNAKSAQPLSGGSEQGSLGTGGGTTPTMTTASLTGAWQIQNEWIDAEITRLQSFLLTLEQAELLDVPEMAEDAATSRGMWSSLINRASQYAAGWIPIIGQVAMIIGLVADASAIAEVAYSLYRRFWVGKETLRHLPGELIKLCQMTIALLRKVRDLPQTPENFEARQMMTTQLTERFEQNMQFYLTDDGTSTASTIGMGAEQLTAALESLMYNDEEIDLGGVRISHRAKVITTA